jgi:hypothetical protein
MSETLSPEVVDIQRHTYVLSPKGALLDGEQLVLLIERIIDRSKNLHARPGRKHRIVGPVQVAARDGALVAFFETELEKPVTRSLEDGGER